MVLLDFPELAELLDVSWRGSASRRRETYLLFKRRKLLPSRARNKDSSWIVFRVVCDEMAVINIVLEPNQRRRP